MLRKYSFLMLEIESEPVSFLVYLKPQCNGAACAAAVIFDVVPREPPPDGSRVFVVSSGV